MAKDNKSFGLNAGINNEFLSTELDDIRGVLHLDNEPRAGLNRGSDAGGFRD